MTYKQLRRMRNTFVHRDITKRNVIVKNPPRARQPRRVLVETMPQRLAHMFYAVDGRRLEKPSKISECHLFLGRTWLVYKDYGKYTLSHLHIMTSQAFRKFVERLFNDMTLWSTLFPLPELV